jgi:hypothetical protein
MTPKQKAEELVDKFYPMFTNSARLTLAKECALIAVDQILNLCWGNNQVGIDHWNEVKQEITKVTE